MNAPKKFAGLMAFIFFLPPASLRADTPWKNGPCSRPDFFPITVWLQDPANARRYKDAGINLYVGLWEGPTEDHLRDLKAAGMPVICDQNRVAISHKDDPTIAGWLLPDEPDNAQELKAGGYGPPVKPEEVIRWYEKAKAADPTRPVLLNLGQGVANDHWVGRGSDAKLEDYTHYINAGDIISFDVYPVAGVEGHNQLTLVPKGVRRLTEWTNGNKPLWTCIECTHIGDPKHKATPAQVRAEVWMAIIQGARGITYFVHEFKPRFNEHALLDDPRMLAGVTAINRQIAELAAVLNSPAIVPGATVKAPDDTPISITTRQHDGATYVFAVGMTGKPSNAGFAVPDAPAGARVEVIGEGRTVDLADGKFADDFEPWGVHLYRIR